MNLSQNQNNFKIALIVGVIIVVLIIAITIAAGVGKKPGTNDFPNAAISSPTVNPQKLIPPTQNRPPVPATVQQIKQQLIANPISDNGDKLLYTANTFRILYVPTPDIFFVQITSGQANAVRQDAQKWFLDKGLTQKDLCNFPVRFVIFNPELKKTAPDFNFLPDGC